MARKVGRLPDNAVSIIVKPGKHCDGGGLNLVVSRTGAKHWSFRYFRAGKAHELGLGATSTFKLTDARERARKLRQQIADGVDVLAERQTAKLPASQGVTFAEAAEGYLATHKVEWKNPKHLRQWRQSLDTYLLPELGKLPVASVDTADVLRVLEKDKLWVTKHETASRLRQRMQAILDSAKASGWREGDNPARWAGHLQYKLAKPSAIRVVQHHPAMPWPYVPKFMAELAKREGVAAKALRFLVLTGVRSSEARGATWEEVDLKAKIWTVPSDRMKGKKGKHAPPPHRVPLSKGALAVLADLPKGSGLIFPGAAKGKCLSDVALSKLLPGEVTVHGFRSSFRDWAGTKIRLFPPHVPELALAHKIGSKVNRAYWRDDLLESRAALMEAWSKYCSSAASS